MTPQDPPTSDPLSGDQLVGLHDSALQCGELLEEGFRLLEGYKGEPETRDAILASLARGFEHLLKLTLWLFEEGEESIGRHHSIPKLLDCLLQLVPAESMPPGRHEFLQHDNRFRHLIDMLGKYGGAGKYSALDAAIGRGPKGAADTSPSETWEEIKLELLDDAWTDLMERDSAQFTARYYPHLYKVVASSLAYGIHSLWWVWVHGPTAERGRRWHPALTGSAGRRINGLAMGYTPS